jgi:hypothetical protein
MKQKFVADDGAEFDNANLCLAYERLIKASKNKAFTKQWKAYSTVALRGKVGMEWVMTRTRFSISTVIWRSSRPIWCVRYPLYGITWKQH